MAALHTRLQHTEQSQQQVLGILSQAMRDPAFLQQLLAGRQAQRLTDGTEDATIAGKQLTTKLDTHGLFACPASILSQARHNPAFLQQLLAGHQAQRLTDGSKDARFWQVFMS